MTDWVKRHPLASYFFVAYGVSWSIAVPLALQAQGVVFHRLPWSLHYLTAFGPAAAALLIARLLREPAGTAERAEPRSVARGIFWWTVGVGSPLLLFAIARAATRIAGQTVPTWTSLGHVNFLPDLGVMAWGLWFLTSGIGEELGWRGFALPRLQRTHSAMTSTLLLAIGWAGWHLPTFFFVPSYTAIGLRILPGFFLGLLAGAIVLTWLYNSSGGSVLAVALWHASFNFVTASPNAGGLVAAVTSTLVMVWAIVIVWRCNWATLASSPSARGGPGYRFHGLPLLLTRVVATVVHFIMQRKQLLGVARRAEMAMSHASAFKTPEGEAAFLAAYHAAMKLWPVPYEEMEVSGRFGITHVVVSGPKDAPPLVLLHGYMATSAMWSPNIADFTKDYRVYAVDVMGQPSKSIPTAPIRNADDYAMWLAETLDALHLDRICLVGQSYGGWLALNSAIAAPERVQKLVLLSPGGGFAPMARQFSLRGMLMVWFPTRVTVNWFMRWLGITGTDARYVLELTYLGLKHFRVPVETLRVMPVLFPVDRLRAMRVPTLLLIGDHEVICDPATALARARQLFPDVQGELVPESSHDMCFSKRQIVDARVLDFLKKTRTDNRGATERSVA
jgi:pimeloyl-ACP methyl ester carboxylesterase/membrane protease YdiL (CAAX protease family)